MAIHSNALWVEEWSQHFQTSNAKYSYAISMDIHSHLHQQYCKFFFNFQESCQSFRSSISSHSEIWNNSKCHFRYQLVLLPDQKSTYKEKVDMILKLKEPKNIHDLQQVFLGHDG